MAYYKITFLIDGHTFKEDEAFFMALSGAKQSASSASTGIAEITIEIRDVAETLVAKKVRGQWLPLPQIQEEEAIHEY